MRDNFRWERDTDNYRRYVSETKDNATGKYKVVYIPKGLGGDMPKIIEGMIVSDSEHGLQCCPRDNDYDGNCAIHSAPGVLRERSRPDHTHQFDAYRYAVETLHPIPDREFVLHGTETGRFSSRNLYSPESVRAMVMQLMTRMNVVEKRQGILFQAVEKIIKLIGWKPSRRVKKVVPPGTYDARIVTVEQKGNFMTVDLEILRT